MDWFKKKLKEHEHKHPSDSSHHSSHPSAAPPEWAPAPEHSHDYGLFSDAPEADLHAGAAFCDAHPVDAPRLLPSDVVERIEALGCRAWGLSYPPFPEFTGRIGVSPGESKGGAAVVRVETQEGCRDACVFSDLPISAGLYDTRGKAGVYFEVTVRRMEGTIAIGTACRPYPEYRQPGWHRLSAALHLDDLRKFFEDSDGGMDYAMPTRSIQPGDVVGCGLDFGTTSIFFTYNGLRLANAFSGVYVPRASYDVYAAVGVYGGPNEVEVNFGGEGFRWKEGNEWAWRVEGHIGKLGGPVPTGSMVDGDDELPTYAEARQMR